MLASPTIKTGDTLDSTNRYTVQPTLLVVDTDPSAAAFIRHFVEGYDIFQIFRPDQILDKVEYYHPHAIIWNTQTQERLPEELTKMLQTPIIECSLPTPKAIALQIGVDVCIAKPISPSVLLQEIRSFMDVHNILIIDDDRDFVQLIERTIRKVPWDLKIRHAYDGLEGIVEIEKERPDLVLLDLIMPQMDGYQVLKRIKNQDSTEDIPVILLSGADFAEEVSKDDVSRIVVNAKTGGVGGIMHYLLAIIEAYTPDYESTSEFVLN